MKSKIYNTILVIIFLIGLSLLLYPTVSDYWNSFTSSRAITHYSDEVANMNAELYKSILTQAQEYNAGLVGRANSYLLSDEQKARYNELLNIDGTGVMSRSRTSKSRFPSTTAPRRTSFRSPSTTSNGRHFL